MPMFKIFPREGGQRVVLTGPIKVGDKVTLKHDLVVGNIYNGMPLYKSMHNALHGEHMVVTGITKDITGHVGYHLDGTAYIYDFEMLQRVG